MESNTSNTLFQNLQFRERPTNSRPQQACRIAQNPPIWFISPIIFFPPRIQIAKDLLNPPQPNPTPYSILLLSSIFISTSYPTLSNVIFLVFLKNLNNLPEISSLSLYILIFWSIRYVTLRFMLDKNLKSNRSSSSREWISRLIDSCFSFESWVLTDRNLKQRKIFFTIEESVFLSSWSSCLSEEKRR